MTKIITVASGKGGVGKSVITSNLALLFARANHRVTLIDLDIGGADQHILYGLLKPQKTLTHFINKEVETLEQVIETSAFHPLLNFIPGTGDTLATANLVHAKKIRLMQHIRKLNTDFIFIDIGAGTHYHMLDFFLMADIHVLIAQAEPTAILDLYRFIKLAAIRRAQQILNDKEEQRHEFIKKEFLTLQSIYQEAEKRGPETYQKVRHSLQSFNPALIINKIRNDSCLNVYQLRRMIKEFIGSDLSVLGEISDDANVSESVCKFMPIVDYRPTTTASLQLKKIAPLLMNLGI